MELEIMQSVEFLPKYHFLLPVYGEDKGFSYPKELLLCVAVGNMKSSVTEGHLCLQGTSTGAKPNLHLEARHVQITDSWDSRLSGRPGQRKAPKNKRHTAICSVSGGVLKEKQSKSRGCVHTGAKRPLQILVRAFQRRICRAPNVSGRHWLDNGSTNMGAAECKEKSVWKWEERYKE